MPRLCERLARPHKQSNSFPASTGQDSCRRAVRIVDIDHRACFRAMIDLCGGVCRGDESQNVHRSRLFTSLEGLRVACWPFSGAIGLIERYEDEFQIHVIRNWCYLGSVRDQARATELDLVATGFDADSYKILYKPILSGSAEIILL